MPVPNVPIIIFAVPEPGIRCQLLRKVIILGGNRSAAVHELIAVYPVRSLFSIVTAVKVLRRCRRASKPGPGCPCF
eukprot:scaffold4066_cov417-Prasinococcus_capsulatus_cf.AAC.7